MRRLFPFALVTALGFLAMGSIAGSWASQTPQAILNISASVDRSLKGDKLPVTGSVIAQQGPRDVSRERPVDQNSKREAPVGCDPLFSPVSAPALSHLFRRCMT